MTPTTTSKRGRVETLRKSRRVERKAQSERGTAEPTGTARRRANRPCSGALQNDRTPRSGARHAAGKQRAYSRGERLGRNAAAPQSTTAEKAKHGDPYGSRDATTERETRQQRARQRRARQAAPQPVDGRRSKVVPSSGAQMTSPTKRAHRRARADGKRAPRMQWRTGPARAGQIARGEAEGERARGLKSRKTCRANRADGVPANRRRDDGVESPSRESSQERHSSTDHCGPSVNLDRPAGEPPAES